MKCSWIIHIQISKKKVHENAWSLNETNSWNTPIMWVHKLHMVHELSKKYQEFFMDCSLTTVLHLLPMNSWTIHGLTFYDQFIIIHEHVCMNNSWTFHYTTLLSHLNFMFWTCTVHVSKFMNSSLTLHYPNMEKNSYSSWIVRDFQESFMVQIPWKAHEMTLKSKWDSLDMLLKYKFMNLMRLVEVLWPIQPIRVMSGWSLYLTTLFLGRLSPPLRKHAYIIKTPLNPTFIQ